MNKEKFIYNPVHKYSDAVPVWLCFPCDYNIGMSSLGYLNLFKILDQTPEVLPERIFSDTKKTFHNIKNIKYFGFSYSFELDFLNIFKILNKYGIPLKASERTNEHPLIFGGGPVLTANPEPYSEIFDFIIIGDGDEIITELAQNFYKLEYTNDKQTILKELCQIKSVYIPSFYDISYNTDGQIKNIQKNVDSAPDLINRRCLKNLTNCVHSPIITANTMFSDTFLVEIARGCPKKCYFCLASYLNLPPKYPELNSIKQSILKGLQYTNKIGLLGALISSHPHFDELCKFILELKKDQNIEISISSLRADKITPLVVDMLVKCGQKTSTIAVESGSERLRNVINKDLTNDQIFKSVSTAREQGLSGLKIYGMIGLPTETDEDIYSLITLMKSLKRENKNFNLTLSVSSFVPKAHTPFQWAGRENNKKLDSKNNLLKKELHKLGTKFRPTSVNWDYIQGILSRGDRRLAPLLEKIFEYGGSAGSWKRAFKECTKYQNYDIPDFDWYACRNILSDEILPWEHISSGISKASLLNEYQNKQENSYTDLNKKSLNETNL